MRNVMLKVKISVVMLNLVVLEYRNLMFFVWIP